MQQPCSFHKRKGEKEAISEIQRQPGLEIRQKTLNKTDLKSKSQLSFDISLLCACSIALSWLLFLCNLKSGLQAKCIHSCTNTDMPPNAAPVGVQVLPPSPGSSG